MKGGDQAFSSGNVSDLGEYYDAAVNDLHASSNDSAVVLKFAGSVAGRNSEDVAPPMYQTLNSGVDSPIYQPLDTGKGKPMYESLNSN